MRSYRKVAGVLSLFGNTLEFYEFTLYASLVSYFAKHFFPHNIEWLSILASWVTFGVAFLMRPIGAFVFGWIGDRWGRRPALAISILSMAVFTGAIGLLPTYEQIGVVAPLLLISCRLFQGLSTGGEYSGTAVYLIERFGKRRPGIISGMVSASCVLGALLGAGIGGAVPVESWRWLFIGGGCAGILLFLLRFFLEESEIFLTAAWEKRESLMAYIRHNPGKVIRSVLASSVNGVLSYILLGFSLMYLQRYAKLPAEIAYKINLLGLGAFFLMAPFAGSLYDRLGGRRYYTLTSALLVILAFPINLFMQTGGVFFSTVGLITLGAFGGAIAGPNHAYLQEHLPVSIRYRVVALSFTVGMAVTGSVTPSLLLAAIEKYHLLLSPALWIILVSGIFWCAVIQERKPMEAHTLFSTSP